MPYSDIYTFVQRIIDRHGSHAAEHADQMLRHFLDLDDLDAAGEWLRIGQAIDDLTTLPAPDRRH